jgi:ABC-type antimicrobial peptide transport system permease subunit
LFTSRDEADAPGSTIVVLGDVAMIGLFGIAAGLPMALAATRLCSSLLFGVCPWDVPTFAGVLVLLAAVLFAAGFLPARRATVIDPASALRVF